MPADRRLRLNADHIFDDNEKLHASADSAIEGIICYLVLIES